MPATFSWFLALRYLMTRWVNLLGMCGVAVAVWALIVVIAVMSGFIEEMTDNIHNASPDLLVTKLRPGCTESEVRPLVAADPDVVSVAPRITQYAMVFPHGIQVLKPTHNLQTRPTTQGYVQLVGIDLAAESRTTGVRDWLMNAPTAVTPEWAPAWRYDRRHGASALPGAHACRACPGISCRSATWTRSSSAYPSATARSCCSPASSWSW
ncbi:MAG: ABC transporter permease [Planctomycetota bacterium]